MKPSPLAVAVSGAIVIGLAGGWPAQAQAPASPAVSVASGFAKTVSKLKRGPKTPPDPAAVQAAIVAAKTASASKTTIPPNAEQQAGVASAVVAVGETPVPALLATPSDKPLEVPAPLPSALETAPAITGPTEAPNAPAPLGPPLPDGP